MTPEELHQRIMDTIEQVAAPGADTVDLAWKVVDSVTIEL